MMLPSLETDMGNLFHSLHPNPLLEAAIVNQWVDTFELKSSLSFDYKIEPALGIVTRNRSDRGARWAGRGDLRRTFVLALRTSQKRCLGTVSNSKQERKDSRTTREILLVPEHIAVAEILAV